MKPAAIGVRVHSGWAAAVAVAGRTGAEQIVERRRIEIADVRMPGAVQPYHFAQRMEIKPAEQHIAKCEAESARLALAGLRDLLHDLEQREYSVVSSCILLSSGRPLPSLEKILASHAMIHTAEGEFFRQAFRDAFTRLNIPVTGIRERDLEQEANSKFGRAGPKLRERISSMGKLLGPPWTADQKSAALGAFIVL
ncbi:MAG TPA: hypothetical protein VJA94_01480 [Candidatus Angelobacter sp.]